MKKCRKCGEEKPFSDFYKMKGMKDGYRNECKACHLVAAAQRHATNPQPARDRARQWAIDNADRVRERAERYRSTGQKQASDRRSHLKRKFGITPEHYDALLDFQLGGCAICHRPPPEGMSFHVDHDHETGAVRGLLCMPCNNALGLFQEDPDLLDRASTYLAWGGGRTGARARDWHTVRVHRPQRHTPATH